MRYVLAVICPPLALLRCHRMARAMLAAVLYVVAIATARWGVGALLGLFVVLWTINIVGDDEADRETRAFIRTVKPIPVVHD